MPEPSRVAIERVDWKSILPALRLASAFKHALQPGKLLVALLAVLAIHFSGLTIDALFGLNESNDGPNDLRVYELLVQLEAAAIEGAMYSALDLEHGFGPASDGVADALFAVFVGVPAYIIDSHPWFSLLFGIDVLFVLALASGVLCRMSATQVCVERLTPLASAACFVRKRWAWFLLTPLMPTILIVVVGALLALLGLIFFNVPWLDVAGSALYGLFLLLGFVIAVASLLLLLALFLMPPALSVEGSDGFDALARSFNYILFRPWQFAVYLFASAVYLAVVYVVVATIATLTIEATGYCIGLGVVSDSDLTEPATWLLARWSELVTAVVLAILLSTLCCLQTQVYVLMRRSADGTPMDQCDGGEEPVLWPETSKSEQADSTDDTAKAEG
ncbi:MAG: hypothetical protein KTR15_13145 [Phycisphaeraceae bacterium]|nr:hypothetical protein [Phycisphaeraceae bacterium]